MLAQANKVYSCVSNFIISLLKKEKQIYEKIFEFFTTVQKHKQF